MLIGLSLSFCVADIIKGLINRDEVRYIISGTRIRNNVDLADVLDNYARFYWQDNPELGREIAADFYNRGMLLQPRLFGGSPPSTAEGWWMAMQPRIVCWNTLLSAE